MIRMAASLALAALALPAAAAAQDVREVPPDATAAQACATLAQVRLKDVNQVDLDGALFDRFHASTLGDHEGAPAAAGTVLRVGISGGMMANGIGGPETIQAWKGEDGQWRSVRVYHAVGRPGPDWEIPRPPIWPAPADAPPEPQGIIERTDPYRDYSSGTFSAEDSARLDAALASPCFKEEPAILPHHLPLKSGVTATCVPDSASWNLDVRQDGTTRRFVRPCRLLGAVGLIVHILQRAQRTALPQFDQQTLYESHPYPPPEAMRDYLVHALPGSTYEVDGKDLRILAYRPAGLCRGTLEFAPEAEGASPPPPLERRWGLMPGFQRWPGGAALNLDFNGPKHERMTFPSTVTALKVQGALWTINGQCAQFEKDGATAAPPAG